MQDQSSTWLSVRVHFVCSIAAYHVHDSLVSPGMIFEKSIDLEDLAINDDDGPAICNHALDLPWSEETMILSISTGHIHVKLLGFLINYVNELSRVDFTIDKYCTLPF